MPLRGLGKGTLADGNMGNDSQPVKSNPITGVRDLAANDEINAHHLHYTSMHPKVVYLPSSTCAYMKAKAGMLGRKTTTAQSTPTWQAGIADKATRGPIAPRPKKCRTRTTATVRRTQKLPNLPLISLYSLDHRRACQNRQAQRPRYAERNPGNRAARSRPVVKAIKRAHAARKFAGAVSAHFAHYNFVRLHETTRVTPAMAANVTDRLWSLEQLVGANE